MKLRDQILKEHTKVNCDQIVKWVGDSQQRFDELFDLFLNDEYRVVQRAGWPLSNAVKVHPEFIQKHFSKLLKNLQKTQSPYCGKTQHGPPVAGSRHSSAVPGPGHGYLF